MKHFIYLLSLIILQISISSKTVAQVSNYTFSESTGNTYSSISSTGTSVSLGDDDDIQVNIGFIFFYNSHNYTQIKIGSNGHIAFGNYAATKNSNALGSTAPRKIEIAAPFWDDLNPFANGSIYYKTTGSSPNRKLIVEYNGVTRYNSASYVNMQVVLYENSNNIEFCYGSSSGSFQGASIGINEAPGGLTHFISITPGSPASSNTSSSNNNITAFPSNGVKYLFTYTAPACQITTNQSVSNITLNSAKLNWVDPSGSHWDIYITTNGGAAPSQNTSPTINDLSTTSHIYSGATASTSYDWYVRSDCDQDNIGTSTWTGPNTFTTQNGKATNPTPAHGAGVVNTSAKTLDWNDVTNASGYHISIGTSSGGTDIVNNVSCANSTYTANSNWSVNTNYYWTVTTNYNTTSTVTGNEWAFTSAAGNHSFPLTEDFESGFTYFNNYSLNNIDFVDETTIVHGGSHSAKNAYSSNDTNTFIETGVLDLSSQTNPVLEFWHIAKTEGSCDKCYIEISTDGGNTYTNLPANTYQGLSSNYSSKKYFDERSYSSWGTSNQTPSNSWWKKETFKLDNYTTYNVRIRFRLTSDLSIERSGWYIDDIHIYQPVCQIPTLPSTSNKNLNSADLEWTDASGSNWDIYVVNSNAAAPSQSTTPTINDIVSNTYTWTGGTANTTYDWYVRSDCGQNNTNTSTWVGPNTFTTKKGKCKNPSPYNYETSIAITSRTIDWDDITNATGYHISIGTSSGDNDVVNYASVSGSSYTYYTNWNRYTKYYWKVTTDYTSGNGAAQVEGDEWAFTTEYETSNAVSGKTSRCSPIFKRPGAGNNPSTTNTKVFYDKFTFTVPASGNYGVKADWTGVDGFVHLYHDSFDPANPTTNCIEGNDDDNNNHYKSKIPYVHLNQGTTYIVIGSSYTQYDIGNATYHVFGNSTANVSSQKTHYYGKPYRFYNIPATDGNVRMSDYGCVDENGWTTYYDDNGTEHYYSDDKKLLSVKKNGNDFGNTTVKLAGESGVSNISSATAPYVSSWGGWFVFNRYWVLTPTNQPTTDVNVKFYYSTADFDSLKSAITRSGGTPPTTNTNMSCFKINSISGNYDPNPANGHSGVPLAQDYNSDGCWIYTHGAASTTHWHHHNVYSGVYAMEYVVKHFSGGGGGASKYTGDGDGSPLPIELLNFDAKSLDNSNILFWKTASEMNVDYYNIERLNHNDSSIEIIGKIKSSGNSNTIKNYSLIDSSPLEKAYYRLTEVDFDGNKESFEWVYLERKSIKASSAKLYPNPAKDIVSIDIINPRKTKCNITIYDLSGKVLFNKKLSLEKGLKTTQININYFDPGTYFLKIKTNNNIITKTLIKF